jgi:hypothetical protein
MAMVITQAEFGEFGDAIKRRPTPERITSATLAAGPF